MVLKIALKDQIQHLLKFRRGSVNSVLQWPELLHKAPQIIFEGFADFHPDVFKIVSEVGVQHQRDDAGARIVAMFRPRPAIICDVSAQILERAASDRGEHVGPDLSGVRPGLRRADGYPEGQFPLNRTGKSPDRNLLAPDSGKGHFLASPEAADERDIAKHSLAAVMIGMRCDYIVMFMPAGSERDGCSAARKIVHDSPVLRDANRVVQREDEAAGANLNVTRNYRKGCTKQSGIGIQATKSLKMALRSPHG